MGARHTRYFRISCSRLPAGRVPPVPISRPNHLGIAIMACARTAAMLAFLVLTMLHRAAALNELAGRELRCCVLEQAPYVMKDPRRPEFGNWSGLAIDVRDTGTLRCARVRWRAGAGPAHCAEETEATASVAHTRSLSLLVPACSALVRAE
jgi:hypothetical protein